jgi:hypothetical protein
MADHWLKSLEDLVASVHSLDYIQRMQPHKFGDSNFAIELTAGRVIFEDPKFADGGVKLIHFLRKRPDLSDQEFERRWQNEHAGQVLQALRPLAHSGKIAQLNIR